MLAYVQDARREGRSPQFHIVSADKLLRPITLSTQQPAVPGDRTSSLLKISRISSCEARGIGSPALKWRSLLAQMGVSSAQIQAPEVRLEVSPARERWEKWRKTRSAGGAAHRPYRGSNYEEDSRLQFHIVSPNELLRPTNTNNTTRMPFREPNIIPAKNLARKLV
jgi:hypothetical protein